MRTVSRVLAWVVAMGSMAVWADDFRIETRVYVADEQEPLSQNLTLFRGGVVYDFPSGAASPADADITVFDPPRRTIRLLDTTRRIRTELRREHISEYIQRQRDIAREQTSNEMLRFLADPQFQESYDEASQTLDLTSSWLSYRLTMLPAKNETVAAQYHEFADWYARLNPLLHAEAGPPFARLYVNRALLKHQALPADVTLLGPKKSAPLGGEQHEFRLHSEHQVEWRLYAADEERIEQVRQHLVQFEQVPFEQFVRPAVLPAAQRDPAPVKSR